MTWEFDIIMQTQLGKRFGKMSAEVNDRSLNGTLSIFDHSEPFFGMIDEDGNCKINGKIITLMRTIEYVATGIISAQTVNLIMQGERNVFQIDGVSCSADRELV